MLSGLRARLARLVAGRELAALERYRDACTAAIEWFGDVPAARQAAVWIIEGGEQLPGRMAAVDVLRGMRAPAWAAEAMTPGMRAALEDLQRHLATSPLGAEPHPYAARWPANVPADVAARRRAWLPDCAGAEAS